MSFDIALSGIQAINDSLDITSHNIANAGTYGYKSGRANFSSLVAGNQVTGVMVGSTTQNIGKTGGILNTGRALDVSINGSGFFISKDAQSGQTQYTRVGIFDASKDGFLIDASGRKVQGYAIAQGTSTLGALGDLAIPTGSIPAVATEKLSYIANLSADWPAKNTWVPPDPVAVPPIKVDPNSFNSSRTTILYDSLGGQRSLTQYFVRTPSDTDAGLAGSVDVHYVLDGVEVGTPLTMTFDAAGDGHMLTPDEASQGINLLTLSTLEPGKNGAVLKDLSIDYTGTTGFAGEATVSTNRADGYAAGNFTGVAMGTDGSVIASYSNGEKQAVGRVAIATFPNEGGLTSINDTSWTTSTSSGEPLVNAPGVGMGGTLNVTSLEGSNVDITSELVGLMTSQRNYQANSKVIQTESTMLQSLMQAV
jgi:flagellar hook protein FlgE